ncbi:MAG: hypothetical protein ACOYL5_13905 [Phototrophicaceae bacterium]|jgi:hypothetical protein
MVKMVTRDELETFIVQGYQHFGGFQAVDPTLLSDPMLIEYVDVGFALLEYYQRSHETQVNENIVGTYVDCAMLMGHLATDPNMPLAVRQRAEEITNTLEDLVNAITRAVERNIASSR